jgi:hypothetical protein
MLGLIKADLASTGKPHLCNRTPSLFLNFRALNALFFEGSHLDLQVVTHEIKFVGTTLIGRVDCGIDVFCWSAIHSVLNTQGTTKHPNHDSVLAVTPNTGRRPDRRSRGTQNYELQN